MRHALVVSWALGTSAGVLLGLSGVQLVTEGITGGRVPPLSHPDVLVALRAANEPDAPKAGIAAPPTQRDAPSRPRPAAGEAPEVATPAPPPPRAAVAPPPGAAVAPPSGAAVTPPSRPAVTPAAPEPVAPAKVRPQPGPAGVARTIESRGGSVAVRYLRGRVMLEWARPNDGYDVKVVRDSGRRVEVVFRGRGRSRVIAFYSDGRPDHRVVERNGRGGDDHRDRGERDGDDQRDDAMAGGTTGSIQTTADGRPPTRYAAAAWTPPNPPPPGPVNSGRS